jgi:hypothetical protein
MVKNKQKSLPPIFSEISDRLASDFLIAEQLQFQTIVKLTAIKFPLSLLPKMFKREKEMILNEVFSKVIDNDKKLSLLLKEAKIQNLISPKLRD